MSQKYKLFKPPASFGRPNEGIHAHRIFGFASVDLLLTALLAALLAYMTSASFIAVFIVLMIVAIAAHAVFGVDTALNKMLLG